MADDPSFLNRLIVEQQLAHPALGKSIARHALRELLHWRAAMNAPPEAVDNAIAVVDSVIAYRERVVCTNAVRELSKQLLEKVRELAKKPFNAHDIEHAITEICTMRMVTVDDAPAPSHEQLIEDGRFIESLKETIASLNERDRERKETISSLERQIAAAQGMPVPMLLWCPMCHKRHVDVGEFATKWHHTHACQFCGHEWRPALVPTVGVHFLPGHKDATDPVDPEE